MAEQTYLSVAQFKARTRSSTTGNDEAILAVVLAASRQVDGMCGRSFGLGAAGEVRYYTADDAGWLDVDPLVAVTEVAADDLGNAGFTTVWATTDYRLTPRNADARGYPYTRIERAPSSGLGFPTWAGGVRVTGTFGWPEPPAPVVEATFLIANRLKSLWDTPAGLSAGTEMGQLDMTGSITPILWKMLKPYRTLPV